MRASVFTDAALAKQAGRFVWLSVDTERAQNVAIVEKLHIESWPTLFVLDSRTQTPALKWLGAATVPELERLLDDGRRAVTGGGSKAEEALARADRLYGERSPLEAAKAYEEAVENAAPGSAQRGRALESLLSALSEAHQYEECAREARKEIPSLPKGPAYADALGAGLGCADEAPKVGAP